jgi:hypothetical protein
VPFFSSWVKNIIEYCAIMNVAQSFFSNYFNYVNITIASFELREIGINLSAVNTPDPACSITALYKQTSPRESRK